MSQAMNSNTKNVLRWTGTGALAAFLAGFLFSLLAMNDSPRRWLLVHVFVGTASGVIGGAVGAFAEVIVHTRRRR